jgi:hypothetical protein
MNQIHQDLTTKYYKYEAWMCTVSILKREDANFSEKAPQHGVIRHKFEGLYLLQLLHLLVLSEKMRTYIVQLSCYYLMIQRHHIKVIFPDSSTVTC